MVLNESLHNKLATILSQSQEGTACHPKLVTKCQQLFKEVINIFKILINHFKTKLFYNIV